MASTYQKIHLQIGLLIIWKKQMFVGLRYFLFNSLFLFTSVCQASSFSVSSVTTGTMAPQKIKLTYFNIEGAAEPV